ncbi:unnamed protein product [Durusdinium trenchii]|uniref:Reverse transcriptase domain-containing protein n=1 Tax=Durusdinium trenchii TaxID=1381693 RepID=A0ABP0NHC3_9DINO
MQPDDGDVPMDGGHTGAARMHCPVPGCVAAAHRGHAGWETFTGLRAHVDAHILGQIPGAVPAEWLRARNMVSCRECSHLISRRCNGGVHRTCLADRMAARPQPLSLPGACGDADLDAVLGSLPSLDEMFSAPVGTRDLISSALLPSAQKEFLRCIVQVLQHNTGDAWAAPEDWQTRLRASGVVVARRGAPRLARQQTDEEKEQAARLVAEQYARRGMPGKAVQRLSGAPPAAPTPDTVAATQAKFPTRPPHQAASLRAAAPPANDISCDEVVRAVRSFPRGAAPGPTGMRPDFLKQLVDAGDEQYGAQALTDLVNLLADGRAPAALRPYLGGARGTALAKLSKTGTADARPLCAREALRRLVGKVLLRSELPALRAHLLPHQLAVGVSAGAEVMPHLYQQWEHHYRADTDRVCLSYDEGNAHNVVDRHVFLTRMQEVAPGLSRWLEYIYPTDIDTKVFFHHVVIPSVAGGQQGCPLMTACHAVVQRLLLESLGLVDPPAGTAVALPTLQPPAQLDMAPCFADDGLLAGPSGEVLRALQHWSVVMPRLGLKLSTASVAPVAGRQHQVDLRPFAALGCALCEDGNFEVLKSPVGDADFNRQYCLQRAAQQATLVQSVGALADPQPGSKLSCRLLVVASGFALRFYFADAAYIGSRLLVLERCHALWTPAAWDGLDGGSELGLAIARCNGLLQQAGLQPPLGDQPDRSLSQPAISHRLREVHVLAWKAAAGTDDVCRLHACSADSAETVLNLVPSRILDTNLSKDDFLTCLGGRLGVDMCLGGGACRFCGLPMDVKGRHPQSCMAGGDAVALHNGLRDLLHDYCARAQLRPQALLDGRRRPADIFLRGGAGLLPALPDGSRPVGLGALALDVAIINSLGPSHWDDTLRGAPDAVTAYAQRKRDHLDTAASCQQVGIHYQPLVWDIYGGCTAATRAFLHRLAGLVATVEGIDLTLPGPACCRAGARSWTGIAPSASWCRGATTCFHLNLYSVMVYET